MAADFWAGYLSGAVGIVVGNPLDLLKTQLQAGTRTKQVHISPSVSTDPLQSSLATNKSRLRHLTDLTRGVAAPILSYGALNALLYMTYNRTLAVLETGHFTLDPSVGQHVSYSGLNLWIAGAVGGLATFVVSAPSELIKCRAQVIEPPMSSWDIARDLWKQRGFRALYLGAGVTSLRDSIGYGFYFWSYEYSKRAFRDPQDLSEPSAVRILLCGGLAGVTTWASIFPLDVIKTRFQTYDLISSSPQALRSSQLSQETSTLLRRVPSGEHESTRRPSSWFIARQAYQTEGIAVFFRGLGVCSARAFIVNAVQWAIYEWTMKALTR